MLQFKNHAEKDFWQESFIRNHAMYSAESAAKKSDEAVEERRKRMKELQLGQKPPENMTVSE